MGDLPQKLKKLNVAVRELNKASNLDQLMERILDVVEMVFERETAALLLIEPDGKHLKIAASRGYDPRVVDCYYAQVGEGVAGMVAAQARARLVSDVTKESDYVPGVNAAVSEMAVPLSLDGEVIGVLDVESRKIAFGEEDMALLEAFGEQAAWAIRQRRTRAEAEERARRLELLNKAARALNAIHDPDRLLTRILELSNEALGFNNVAILVADPDGLNLEVRKALRPKGVEGLKIPVDQGVVGTVFRTNRPEIVADVAADPRYISGGLEGTRSEMVAPLRINGETIGVMDAEGTAIEAFGKLDLEVFSAFSAQVATALRNAQLMADLEDRALRLKQITRTGHALNTILNADEILDQILAAVTEALGLDRVAILLIDPENAELVLHAAKGYGDVLGKRIPIGQGVTGDVAISGEPTLINDVSSNTKYLPGVVDGASEMAVPLRVYGEIFGVLDTESPLVDAFRSRDLDLFQAFADQAAVALNNARLFRRLEVANNHLKRNVEEMSHLNRELETYAKQISEANKNLESRIQQLTTLHQAGQAITSSLDLNHTLEAILQMSSSIVESSSGAIVLMDSETKEMRIAAQAGIMKEGSGTIRKYDLPLKIGERQIGMFELMRKANEKLGEGEKKMLETMANQAAIAIENARLFEDTQRVYYETLKSLAKALEARDDYTRGHSERVADLALAIATELDLGEKQRHLIYNSALLHDIGKIGVRDAVLLKPRRLTEDEMEVIRKHPTFGSAILSPLKFLGSVSDLVHSHHERWDGTGYPAGLKAEEIPLPSRIISVADTYDAMTSTRPYRAARSPGEALREMEDEAGKQLDPGVVDAFLRVMKQRLEDKAEPVQSEFASLLDSTR